MTKVTQKWTLEEIELFKNNYHILSKEEILKLFPNRSWKLIKNIACNYKLKFQSSWTDSEKDFIKNNYRKCSKKELLELLPNRKWKSIRYLASKIKVTNNNAWKSKEYEILKSNYGKISNTCLSAMLPDRTLASIKSKALKSGLSTGNKKWSNKEVNILKNKYEVYGDKSILKLLENRTLNAIRLRANDLGLFRIIPGKHSDLSMLLQNSFESYYWIGFLLADASFFKNSISLNLAEKDINHVREYAKFIKYKKEINKSKIFSSDTSIVPVIRNKFDIQERKTYNPPDISIFKNMNKDLIFSLIIGFIDGDGCISKRSSLQVAVHQSWIKVMEYFYYFLHDYLGYSVLNKNSKNIYLKENISGFAFSRKDLLRDIKKKSIEFKLPFLKRKWNRIDEDFIYKTKRGRYGTSN